MNKSILTFENRQPLLGDGVYINSHSLVIGAATVMGHDYCSTLWPRKVTHLE